MLANVLLGINQGLTWSTTVIMKIDLVGPVRRGLAMGINDASGYLALAATAMATGAIAAHAGLRPGPFLLGAAYAALCPAVWGLGQLVRLAYPRRRRLPPMARWRLRHRRPARRRPRPDHRHLRQ